MDNELLKAHADWVTHHIKTLQKKIEAINEQIDRAESRLKEELETTSLQSDHAFSVLRRTEQQLVDFHSERSYLQGSLGAMQLVDSSLLLQTQK